MGLWDTVKNLAMSAKCMTGWHGGEYEHIQGKPKCFLGKTCPDCGEYVTKNKHKFGSWEYITYGKCDAVRKCIYCKFDEKSIQHSYERHGKDSNCRIIEICSSIMSPQNQTT